MLEIIIVFALYVGIQKIVDIPFVRKIREAQTSEEAIKQRKRLKTIRTVLFVVYLIGYAICGLAVNIDRWKIESVLVLRDCFMWLFLMFLYLYLMGRYGEFMGNISIFGKDDYLNKYSRFALFLRGFGDDNYSKRKSIYKSKRLSNFSEYWFMYVLQKRIHACAIGMTKESDSPFGAQRIYVNDESWKEDVSELMEKARAIYVLVNDRPSCIWEIEQTKSVRDKTVYIVDDIEKYNNARNLVDNEIGLPDIPMEMLKSYKRFYIAYNNHEFLIQPYENSVESYCKLLRFDERIIQKKIELSNLKQKGWCKFFELQMLLLFWIAVVIPGISYVCVSNKNIAVIIVFLLASAIIINSLFKRIKEFRKE